MKQFDVIILGAGAAGLMCAAKASQRGCKVVVLDHQSKPGTKILFSGGGRCNFSNFNVSPENYSTQNRPFCISALKRYPPREFLQLIQKYGVEYEIKNKTHLFCKNSSRDILNALQGECRGVVFIYRCQIQGVKKENNRFVLQTNQGKLTAKSLVVATGGITCPHMGATDLGLKIAKQFGHHVIEPRAGLVSLSMNKKDKNVFGKLAGISLPVKISFGEKKYSDSLLFTHDGLSGPALYNITLYAKMGDSIEINLCPNVHLSQYLETQKKSHPKAFLRTVLSEIFPQRLVLTVKDRWFVDASMQKISKKELNRIAESFERWTLSLQNTPDIHKAKVTVGGVDTRELSSKTMESLHTKGLYFVGEVMDMAGEQGGYNLHWAWASGWCAGCSV